MEISNCVGGGVNGHKIISLENLFFAWNEFKKGKMGKEDVQKFAYNLEDNIFKLYFRLKSGKYQHSDYTSFYLCDPKLRHIHKATIEDRIVHRAIYRVLLLIFDKSFIFDSYSSRAVKGTHKAVRRFRKFACKLSKNNTKTVWVLKCDIKKFFNSIDHLILIKLIKKKIKDEATLKLIKEIIFSFKIMDGKGLPLGNLTSQLFANIYMNELDQFIKRKLRIKYYVRYADDFVILDRNRDFLIKLILSIDSFLQSYLSLQLHPQKVIIKKWHKGVDFLGYISFPHYSILRTNTKRRILKKINKQYIEMQTEAIDRKDYESCLQSYFGVLKHCRGYKIRRLIEAKGSKWATI